MRLLVQCICARFDFSDASGYIIGPQGAENAVVLGASKSRYSSFRYELLYLPDINILDRFSGTRSKIFNEIVLKGNHFLNNVT